MFSAAFSFVRNAGERVCWMLIAVARCYGST